MKKVLLLTGVLLALMAPMASAQLNLYYTDCAAGGGTTNFNNPFCTLGSAAPPITIVGSAVLPAVPQWVGIEGVLDLEVEAPSLPDFWRYNTLPNPPECRTGFMIADFNFVAGPFGCFGSDPWGGAASGGLGYESGFGGANRARIKVAAALASPKAIAGGVDSYLFKILIVDPRGNVCAGCEVPACIVFNSLKIAQPAGAGDFLLTAPGTNQHVTYNSPTLLDCPGATPTKSSTWGSVKSLYR